MKTKVTQKPKKFEPFEVTITIENESDLYTLMTQLNGTYDKLNNISWKSERLFNYGNTYELFSRLSDMAKERGLR